VPPLPICEERVAVHELLSVVDEDFETQEKKSVTGNESQSFAEIELTDFAVYLPKDSHHPLELRGLQELAGPKRKRSTMLFDGILCAGPSRRYVQAVAFEICSIGNYGKKYHTVGGEIWIQSVLNSKSDIYYRLKAPSSSTSDFIPTFCG
jgi:DNA (cytosine-5)-methyltransferase 1